MADSILIGITGKFGVGKSTLAEMLASEIPDAWVVAFADNLKREVHMMLTRQVGLPFIDTSIGERNELKGECLGPMYQGYGELCRRLLGEDCWIKALAMELPTRAIVADVRHHNEAAWLRSRGGILVALSGPCRRPGDQRSTMHPSEIHVAEIARAADVPVVNDYTLDHLRTQARGVARMALGLSGTTI